MKLKKLIAISMVAAMSMSMVACGNSDDSASKDNDKQTTNNSGDDGDDGAVKNAIGDLSYADLTLGEDYTDITTTIKVLSHRTDLLEDEAKHPFSEYVAAFNEMYPNITVEIEGITDYANDSLLRLQGGDWGDIMMIPAVDKADLSTYFIPYGDLATMESQIRFANTWEYGDLVYGVPSTGNAQGIVYNKKVFEEAGVTAIPKTPEEFIAALQAIKDNTDAIPLYTNYAAGWTMSAWDAYIGGSATGKSTFMNQDLIHSAAPFSDPGDGTGPYNVYKILYDAVANGLTEDDYSTTDWEGCKGMINNGEIGCMVLGSWAVQQCKDAGDTPEDVGYMPFPITVDGKQYAGAGGNYSFGINNQADSDNQIAAMVYLKWLIEESSIYEDEGSIPALKGEDLPEALADFEGVELLSDNPPAEGEETLFNDVNNQSEVGINNDDYPNCYLLECALYGSKTLDEVIDEWNSQWSAAQEALGVDVNM